MATEPGSDRAIELATKQRTYQWCGLHTQCRIYSWKLLATTRFQRLAVAIECHLTSVAGPMRGDNELGVGKILLAKLRSKLAALTDKEFFCVPAIEMGDTLLQQPLWGRRESAQAAIVEPTASVPNNRGHSACLI
eukprot:6461694-Amphidinium_carterae.2